MRAVLFTSAALVIVAMVLFFLPAAAPPQAAPTQPQLIAVTAPSPPAVPGESDPGEVDVPARDW